jgi:glycosyltransferase involved in cell wall biosynthesis
MCHVYQPDQRETVHTTEAWLQQFHIAVVIPCYGVEREIATVLRSLPAFVRHIIAVDDASPDRTGNIIAALADLDARIVALHHATNLGVGGATLAGFRKALEIGAQIVVKMDGDGQMHVEDLPALVTPLIHGEADYTKGNRFHDVVALRQMPWLRRFGNTLASFLVKAATGYWQCFDPNNGYVAIRAAVLARLPLDTIDHSYFFEISMLQALNCIKAVVRDVPMPARYGSEVSHLSTRRVLREFPRPLAHSVVRRIVRKQFLNAVPREPVGGGPLAPVVPYRDGLECSMSPPEPRQ